MTTKSFVRCATAVCALVLSSGAMAQAMAPMDEVLGQPIQVVTNGITNTVYFDQGGSLRILTPGGNTVPGTWTVGSGQLCLSAAGAQECVPYNAAFQTGQPLTLTSSCNASEMWLAQATNAPPPPPPPPPTPGPERGK